jgi:hypothetical protein
MPVNSEHDCCWLGAKRLIKALLDDLAQKVAAGLSPDAIVFSGDLVQNPDEPDVFKRFADLFFHPLLSATRLSAKDVAFCPGNHDVSFKAIEEWRDERVKLQHQLAHESTLDEYLETGPARAYVRAISLGFYDFVAAVGHPWNDQILNHVYSFPAQKLSLVALSTAFGCGTEGSAYDRGKLALPIEHTLRAFQSVPADFRCMSFMHHTLSDLSEQSSSRFSPVLEKESEGHFFGHIHLAKPSAVTAPGTSCFLIQGGALYERNGAFNSYSIVDIGPEKDQIAAHYRTYFAARDCFDAGINVVKEGTFYSSDAAKSYWQTLVPVADNDDICLFLMDTQVELVRELDKTITSKPLTDTFVDPVIGRESEDPNGGQQKLTTSQILHSTNNLVIACDSEYGGSSLISFLAIMFHKECVALPKAVVPCVIDARTIKGAYPAVVDSALRGGLPDSSDARFKLRPLHNNGRLVLLLDNLDPSNKIHIDFVSAVRSSYPKARLVLLAKLPFIDMQRLKPVVGIADFDFYQIRTLTRSRVRSLVEKWKLPARYRTDTVVEEISTRFEALGIPQTAAYVTIYLSVLEDVDGFNPINSSTVIEQFVESALQKYKPVYAFRSSFDYRNQIDYLGAIAEQMCRQDRFLVDYSDLYDWTKQYFERLGQEHDFSKLISHFVENKVFSDEGNSIYFRYNIFLSFFIAHRIQQSPEFRTWLLQDHRYADYIPEIDIYCGLSRGDSSLIEFFSTEFESFAKRLEDIIRPLAWADRLEKLTLPTVKKTEAEAFADRIVSQLTSEMPPEERDEAVGDDSPDPGKSSVPRQQMKNNVQLWLASLRAYTVSLKNLENLPKADKERHLRRILQGWSSVMLYACILFKEVIEKREVEFGNLKFRIDMPAELDARILRSIFVHIPVLISDWVRKDLGSQKLALQLKSDDIPNTLSDSFLQTSLYADLKLDGFLGRLKTLREKAAKAKSVSFMEFLLVKMHSMFLRLGIDHNEQSGFLHIAAELNADIKGLEGEERQREIEKYTTDLRRKGQVQQIRENVS